MQVIEGMGSVPSSSADVCMFVSLSTCPRMFQLESRQRCLEANKQDPCRLSWSCPVPEQGTRSASFWVIVFV